MSNLATMETYNVNPRRPVREALRKAGSKLLELDDAYSGRIVDMYMGSKDSPRDYADNPLLGAGAGLSAVFGGGTPLKDNNVAAYTSAAAKYVAPVGGMTLAGKGILDLTAAFGTAADMPEEQTLVLQ